jgi:hypothetical protein
MTAELLPSELFASELFANVLINNTPPVITPIPSIIAAFISGSLFSFTESSNMILGNNPLGKDCVSYGNQCTAQGLNTRAGFSIPCTLLNQKTVFIENVTNTEFFSGAQVTLYNLIGGTDSNTTTAIINNVSTDGQNTYLTFSSSITDNTSGYIALNVDFQAHSEGQDTTASAVNSYAGGKGAISDLHGKFSRSDSYFNVPGDGQYSLTSCGCITVDTTPTILQVDGNYFSIRNNTSYMFVAMLAGHAINGTADSLFLRYGIINNNNGTVTLRGSVETLGSDINVNGWSVAITADDINNALQIQVIGDNENTIHWKCRCDTIELG